MRVPLAALLSIASLGGCGGQAASTADAAAPPVLGAPLAIDAGSVADAGLVHDEGARDAVPESGSCGRCHPRIAAEWASSRHHTSFDDPLFVAEWSERRDPWCVSCHAPLARDADDRRVHEGVGCASCHVVDGVVVSDATTGHTRHETRVDPSLATEALCARCHQFGFPRAPEIPMQDTVSEWRSSGTERSCIDCHARTADGGFSHAFTGMRDPALLARALWVEARAEHAERSTRVTLRLRSRAGHAVPTGDLFRRLRVSASIEGVPRSQRSETLLRELAIVPGAGRIPVADHRVPARGARDVVLELPAVAGAARIRYRIELHALDPRVAHRRGLDDADVRRVLARGAVELAPP